MTESREDRGALRAEDEAFAERLAASFAPAPLSPARRAAFDDALAARLERRRRSRLLVPAFAAAAGVIAAALAWFGVTDALDPSATGRGGAEDVVAEAAAARWERELLDLDSLSEIDDADGSERLPDDYVAIAGFFLDG